jgi:PBP1b-binding outer membrane lipoprotein LpoB
LGINIQIIILTTKKTIMKKLFAIALIAVSFAACNSAETKTEEAAEATADSLNTQVEAIADSAKATIDSAAATVDSAAAATVDSVKAAH